MDRASILNEVRNPEEMQFIYSFVLVFKSYLSNTCYGPGSVLELAANMALIINAAGSGNRFGKVPEKMDIN